MLDTKYFPFDFGFKISRELTKPGAFLIFFGFTHLCASVNVALSQSYWRDLVNKLKKAKKNFSNYLETSQTLRLTVTLPWWGRVEVGTGAFGELCIPLKKSWLRPWEVYRASREQTYTHQGDMPLKCLCYVGFRKMLFIHYKLIY